MKAAFLLGRLVFGGFFINAGLHHFQKRKETAGYAAAKKVPLPELAAVATGAMLIVGGANIMLGVKPKLGTLAVMGVLGGVTPVMHDFWRTTDPAQRQSEAINFMKNTALLGGALALMGVEEPWPLSLPVWRTASWETTARRLARQVAA
jgi:uncharacterized membrane protein YphA (DoxX/SURF4 family)